MNNYYKKIKYSLFKVREIKWKLYEILLIFVLLLLFDGLTETNVGGIAIDVAVFAVFILIKGFKGYKN